MSTSNMSAQSVQLQKILMGLRPYQYEAHLSVMVNIGLYPGPLLLAAATGAGKSHIIASLATELQMMTNGRVLILQPKAELVKQNRAKLTAAGLQSSVYSASISKSFQHKVIYATPLSINKPAPMSVLKRTTSVVIIDEAHEITPTLIRIIDELREANPKLIVVGLTATPYRTREGYIYAEDVDGVPMLGEEAVRPFFDRLVFDIRARELIEEGWLVPPVVSPIGADAYDTSAMELRKHGAGVKWAPGCEVKAFVGKGRRTSRIVADFTERTKDMGQGIIFAATLEHVEEVMESLPLGVAAVLSSKHTVKERNRILASYRAGHLKWLVNVGILTTGFDHPPADHVILLRKTESPGLLQQIIGRVLRTHPGKTAGYILDYAENMGFHFPDDRDVFDPEVRPMATELGERISIYCPDCETEQPAVRDIRFIDQDYDEYGYAAERVKDTIVQLTTEDGRPIPVHHNRRCSATLLEGGKYRKCGFFWASKVCGRCEGEVDYAARNCDHCGTELVDPNDKLVERSDGRLDPYVWRVTLKGTMRTRTTTTKDGQPYDVVKMEGVPEPFWVPRTDLPSGPSKPWSSFQIKQYETFTTVQEGQDWFRWRRQIGSKYLEFGGWTLAGECGNCQGTGMVTRVKRIGAYKIPCIQCQGTGSATTGWSSTRT